jgi:hypothetical protein
VGQEVPLIGVERGRSWRVRRIETHPSQRNNVGHRGNQHFPVVVEADETAIEQVIG